ncbi:putative Fcf2 pre-rRNA processing [Septoria linicola]|nr:putative Fcf2 pre-rRNA processing [Septoria linicola]
MATATKQPPKADSGSEDDLTDEQIQQELAAATARLQAQAKDMQLTKRNESKGITFPKLETGDLPKPYFSVNGHVATVNSSRLVEEKYRRQQIRKVEDPVAAKKAAEEKKKATAGSDWYNLPKTELTPELKRDLQLIKMRNVLDPHRHYKKDNGKMKAPEYSQVGTIKEGATEFFSGRIENKKRKRTFAEEVLAGEHETGRFKNKYGQIQDKKTSGKKAFYKALKEKRSGGMKKGSG